MKEFSLLRFPKIFRRHHNKSGNVIGEQNKDNITSDIKTLNNDQINVVATNYKILNESLENKTIEKLPNIEDGKDEENKVNIDAEECIQYEIDALEVSSEKQISIHFAARTGSLDLLKILLDLGENINSKDGNGCTALQIACSNGHKKLVKFLLEKGANVSDKDKPSPTSNANEKPKILLIPMNFVEKSVQTIKFWFQIKRNDVPPENNEPVTKENKDQPEVQYKQDNEKNEKYSKKDLSDNFTDHNVMNQIEKEVYFKDQKRENIYENEKLHSQNLNDFQTSKITQINGDIKTTNNCHLPIESTEKTKTFATTDCEICRCCMNCCDGNLGRPKRQVKFSQKISIIESNQVREVFLSPEAEKNRESVLKKRKSRKNKLKF